MQNMQLLLCLLFMLSVGAALKSKSQSTEWDYRVEAEKVYTRGCANLTLVLDNWKYAIMTQVKDLLLNDHSTVLPDYARIGPLSEALGDLYKDFNSLKERLGELTSKFEGVELLVDEVSSGRRKKPRAEGNAVEAPQAVERPRCKNRVVIRRVKKVENP